MNTLNKNNIRIIINKKKCHCVEHVPYKHLLWLEVENVNAKSKVHAKKKKSNPNRNLKQNPNLKNN